MKTIVKAAFPRSVLTPLYHRMARHYLSTIERPPDTGKKSLLLVNHACDQDIRALQYVKHDYNCIEVDGSRLFKAAQKFFCRDVRDMFAPYDSENPDNIAEYRKVCTAIFEELRRRFSIDLIVLTSDSFFWVREFIVVAREAGVKTIVLDKEGTISPYSFDTGAKLTREFVPFISDHIFVWSERQRQFWNKIGVEQNRITVIGQPRSDLFYCERNSDTDSLFDEPRPLVTLFSYDDTAYIPHEEIRQGVSWRKMKRETHDEIFRLAGKSAGFNFVIKTHPQQTDLKHLQRRYGGLRNLRVIGGSALSNELIQRSELIIAFQTTAVIEAMFLDRRVIYTAWDDNYARLAPQLLPFHEAGGILKADSMARFREACRKFISGDMTDFEFSSDEIEARNQFVNQYLYRPDGHVCERFFASLSRFM